MRTAGHPLSGPNRHGVSAAIAALALAVLVVGAAGVVYFSGALGGASSKTTTCASVSTFSAGGVETTFTIPCVGSESNAGGGGGGEQSQGSTSTSSSFTSTTPTSTTSSITSSTTPTSTTSTTSTSTSRTSSTQTSSGGGTIEILGTYYWSEQKDEGNYVENITAGGLFDVNFSYSTDMGQGTGDGTLWDNYTGYCAGSSTFNYNFTFYAGLDKESGNLTLGWGTANPSGGSTTIACGGQTSDAAFGIARPVAPVFASIKIPQLGGSQTRIQGNEGDVAYIVQIEAYRH